jgi:hypothetical protein
MLDVVDESRKRDPAVIKAVLGVLNEHDLSGLSPGRHGEAPADEYTHILRHQLQVTAEVFWGCVSRGILPARSAPPAPNPKALPLHVLNELITRVGMTPDAAAALTLPEATAALAEYWRGQG